MSVLRVAPEPRVKMDGRKSALNPSVVYSTDRSKYWSYSLLLCGLFYEAICIKSCLVLFCYCIVQSF